MLFWLPIVISGLGALVAVFAYRNAARARQENQENVLFKLKVDTLVATKEVEVSWQQLVSELDHATHDMGRTPAVTIVAKEAFAGLKEIDQFLRESLDNAKSIAENFDEHFDSCSAKETSLIYRKTLVNKISLNQSKEEMRRKLSRLAGTIRDKSK